MIGPLNHGVIIDLVELHRYLSVRNLCQIPREVSRGRVVADSPDHYATETLLTSKICLQAQGIFIVHRNPLVIPSDDLDRCLLIQLRL